jgi:hypothetical protein
MKPVYVVSLLFSAVVGAIALTHNLTVDRLPPGVSCASDRVAAFGWTDRRAPLAELAAIANWQRDTEKKEPGYGDWHLARKRSMKCQTFRNSSHIQCIVSAKPCRYDKS